ncbi:MAG: TerB family tellurite resistance protein [Pseudomonadota bacterium]
MLKNIFERFADKSDADIPQFSEDEARVAVAAILVSAARADHNYDADEQDLVSRILAARYELSDEDADALRQSGEETEQEAVDLFRFTHAIKTAIPHEDRTSILEALWSVALADQDRDAREDALIRKLTDLLGLAPRDSALARQHIEERMGL